MPLELKEKKKKEGKGLKGTGGNRMLEGTGWGGGGERNGRDDKGRERWNDDLLNEKGGGGREEKED